MERFMKSVYLTRTTLAKRVNRPMTQIERMLFREVIEPDAWLIDGTQKQPIFFEARLQEIENAISDYFAART
jgi:hypothetical protein